MFSTITKPTKDAKIFPISENIMNFDGASKGNPGLSGAGAVIYKNGKEIWSAAEFLGYKTNNQAEYQALVLGLKGALVLGITILSVFGDSLLVINQVNGIYKVKSESIFNLYEEVQSLKLQFEYIEFNHVYRDKNKRADELSNIALLDLEEPKLTTPLIAPLIAPLITIKHKEPIKNKQLSITQFFQTLKNTSN